MVILIHLFTASSGVLGLFAISHIANGDYIRAFWYMASATLIDATDGTLARIARAKEVLPRIDGALLDNLVDYLNYVITPAFFVIQHPFLLPPAFKNYVAMAMVISSAYQFTQIDAKTRDHFFKGFPSYWNLAIFHLYILDLNGWINAMILSSLAVLVFIPIKYLYISRLRFVSSSIVQRRIVLGLSIVYGLACLSLLLGAAGTLKDLLNGYTILFIFFYTAMSIYRTLCPLSPAE